MAKTTRFILSVFLLTYQGWGCVAALEKKEHVPLQVEHEISNQKSPDALGEREKLAPIESKEIGPLPHTQQSSSEITTSDDGKKEGNLAYKNVGHEEQVSPGAGNISEPIEKENDVIGLLELGTSTVLQDASSREQGELLKEDERIAYQRSLNKKETMKRMDVLGEERSDLPIPSSELEEPPRSGKEGPTEGNEFEQQDQILPTSKQTIDPSGQIELGQNPLQLKSNGTKPPTIQGDEKSFQGEEFPNQKDPLHAKKLKETIVEISSEKNEQLSLPLLPSSKRPSSSIIDTEKHVRKNHVEYKQLEGVTGPQSKEVSVEGGKGESENVQALDTSTNREMGSPTLEQGDQTPQRNPVDRVYNSSNYFNKWRVGGVLQFPNGAISDLSLAIQDGLSPQDLAYAHYLRGLALLRLGKTKKGLEDLGKSCQLKFSKACQFFDQIQ